MFFLQKASSNWNKIARAQHGDDIFTNTNDTVVTHFSVNGFIQWKITSLK